MGIDDREKSRSVDANVSNRSEAIDSKTEGHLMVEEEETHVKPAARAIDLDLEAESNASDADDGEEERPYREPQERRRNFANARELMTDELRTRATQSSDRLRACLTGSIIVKLKERGEKYLFDWTGATPRVESTDQAEGDCVINVSEGNLLKIAAGELNPQIGMLSEKIQVQGKLSLAVYFFNLIAPFPQN